MMEGNRSSDICYLLATPNTCQTTIQNETNHLHRRMGHVSHSSLKDTIVAKAINGVPNLKEPEIMCGPC